MRISEGELIIETLAEIIHEGRRNVKHSGRLFRDIMLWGIKKERTSEDGFERSWIPIVLLPTWCCVALMLKNPIHNSSLRFPWLGIFKKFARSMLNTSSTTSDAI